MNITGVYIRSMFLLPTDTVAWIFDCIPSGSHTIIINLNNLTSLTQWFCTRCPLRLLLQIFRRTENIQAL